MKYLGPKTDGDDLATQSDVTGGGAGLSDATPDAITPDQAGSAGTATDAARADHVHAIAAAAPSSNLTASTTNGEGSSSSFARADHSHAISTGTPGTITPDASASAGSSANLARADHTHAIAAGAAGTITGSNAEGTSTSFARADHNHALGTGVVGTTQLASAVSESLVPTGAVMAWATNTAPTGWLICDGTLYSTGDYATLFSVIGRTYGGSEIFGTFEVPDLRTRVIAGRFIDDPGGDFDTLGEQGGSRAHTLTTAEMPSHDHDTISGNPGVVTDVSWATINNVVNTGSTTGVTRNFSESKQLTPDTSNTGGDEAHNNLQPYIVLNYIIKT